MNFFLGPVLFNKNKCLIENKKLLNQEQQFSKIDILKRN